jgi:hypothetical protein
MEPEILKYFTRGLDQSDFPASDENPTTEGNRDPVEVAASGFIANLYSRNNRIFRELHRSEIKTSSVGDSHAPLSFSMRLASGQWDDLLPEFIFLCNKHELKIHPATLPWLLSKKRDFKTTASISACLPNGLDPELEKWFPDYLPWINWAPNTLPTATRIKTWIWFNIRNRKKVEFSVRLEKIWNRLSTPGRITAIETIPPGYFQGLPHILEKDMPYSSKKLNRALIYLRLGNPDEELKEQITGEIRRFVFEGELDMSPAFTDLCNTLKVEEPETLLREITGVYPTAAWLRENEFAKLPTAGENGKEELLWNVFYAALWSGDLNTVLEIEQKTEDTRDFRKFFEPADRPFEIRFSPAFFNKLAGYYLESQNPRHIIRLSLFLTYFPGLWSDSVSVKMLSVLKDSGNKLFDSEKGVEAGKAICSYLQTRANPILLPHLEKNAENHFLHPLAEDFQKTIRYWQERKAMRISFAKASNN